MSADARAECVNCWRPIFRDALRWFHLETGVPWCAVELFAVPRVKGPLTGIVGPDAMHDRIAGSEP